MPHHPWLSVGEFANRMAAAIVSKRLTVEGIPNRIVLDPLNRRLPRCSIWVPPDWHQQATEILSRDAAPEEELTKAALSYPPPDDEDNLK